MSLNEEKRLRLIIDAQPNIVLVTTGKKLVEANKAFLDFFEVNSVEEFKEKKGDCICDFFISDDDRYLKKIYPDGSMWIDLVLNEFDITHRAKIKDNNGVERVFEVKANVLKDENVDYKQEVVVFTDITTIEHQALLIENMEIPILEIDNNMLLAPLIGMLDSIKSQKLMIKLLNEIKKKNIKVSIVDIEGIVVIDSAVAAHLIKLTKATSLMGCQTILSGITPEVAQTIVNLGIDLEGVVTTSTLKDALKFVHNEK